MDYTTVERVRRSIGGKSIDADELLELFMPAASRAIDRYVTHSSKADCHDYFTLATVTSQTLKGWIDIQGHLLCYPRKAVVNSVSSLAYRFSPAYAWSSVESSLIEIDGGLVRAWADLREYRGYSPVQVQISYNGGFGDAVDELPEDLVEACTVLVARYFNEDQSGLGDSIGVAELGTLIYTKAWPVRVREMLNPFVRSVPW